jgi:hypothetical protein
LTYLLNKTFNLLRAGIKTILLNILIV